VASGKATASALPANVSATIALTQANVWSVARPYLYALNTQVRVGNKIVDSVNTSFGVRNVAWSADHGLLLNEQRVKMRGFCEHENFAGVGSAIPERVNLFRLQQMRGVGGNAWRASHNPPSPSLLELADRLGVVVLDENRVFQTALANNMADLVSRDRNHPAVIFWSFCNEPCEPASAATASSSDGRLLVALSTGDATTRIVQRRRSHRSRSRTPSRPTTVRGL
jgi:beta-galactosidase/beta-glucuronidase